MDSLGEKKTIQNIAGKFLKIKTIRIKNFSSELLTGFKQVCHIKNCWILFPGLVAVLLVYTFHHFNIYTWLITRNFNENIAVWLVSMIFVILLTKSLLSRDPLMIYLAVLAFVFLIRELDDTDLTFFGEAYLFKSKKLVDFLLIGMGLWAYIWHEKLFACLNRSMMLKVSLFGVMWTYLFSQLIARRVFRGVFPNERLLHVPLEETVETAAHLFFLVFCVFLFFVYSNRQLEDKEVETERINRNNRK
jgi:hypothetical protein